MLEIFLKTLPFFGLIGLGYGAGRTRFFPEEATAWLTKFVFYFALSAMLFRFSANLSLDAIFDARLAAAYLWGTTLVWAIGLGVAFLRGLDTETAAIEAQCAAIGNTGFLGVPMLAVLLGQAAIAPLILILTIDMVVFSSVLVILVTGARSGLSGALAKSIGMGLLKNPMVVSILAGLAASGLQVPIPGPANEFLTILGNAATPGALFAIGASLASKSAERLHIAGWLSFCKLILHPAFVALAAFVLFPVAAFPAAVAVAAAALPVAGNVFILAQHYGIAPQRVSASILISTGLSILTISGVIALVSV
ncbi:AEC family transporter [Roseivivax sp. CAU 1761]